MINLMARKLATIDSLPALFDESRRPIYAIDAERRIVYCNPALAAWVDITGGRVLGRVVEYHSEPHENDNDGGDAPLTDLCPPPKALAGEGCAGTLSCVGRGGRLIHRKAEFIPLAPSRRTGSLRQAPAGPERFAVLVLLDETDMSTQEVATQLSGEAAADELHRTIRRFQRSLSKRYSIESLLGSSAAMQKIRAQVSAAAASGANTLIIGPRGSGRGHVARAIHYRAMSDATTRLVSVNCEELTDDLLRRGLENIRPRVDETKNRPTLLLENLDAISAAHQSIFLAAVSQRGAAPRVIATYSKPAPLAAADDEQSRRGHEEPDLNGAQQAEESKNAPASLAALLDAISTITIRIPPLADRIEDLPLLAQYFLEACNRGNDKQVGRLRPDALDLLALYSWPGELVQLQKTIAAAHRGCRSHEITPADLPSIVHHALRAASRNRREPERIVLDELLASIEKEAIVRALAQAGGNKSEAAVLLGMTRPRLYRRLVQLGLAGESADEPQEEQPEFIEGEPTE
jgi:DNA-binding NtrC family response regulator